jgi:hypothetical protein
MKQNWNCRQSKNDFNHQTVDDQTLLVALPMVIENRFWLPSKKTWLLDGDWNFQSHYVWQMNMSFGYHLIKLDRWMVTKFFQLLI